MCRERYLSTEEEKVELLYSYKASHLTRFITRTRKKSLYILPYNIQQWTIGPVDREIVPLSAEMDHPT
jgi:hypothetical protein